MTTTTRKPRTGKKKTSEARRSAMAQRWAQMMDLASTMELAMTEDAGVMAACEGMAERTGYSLRNAALIVGQLPTAREVKSFKKWQEEGRQVRKGEKAAYILAPTKKRREDQEGGEQAEKAKPEQAEKPEHPAAEDAPQGEDGEAKQSRRFVLVPVFDVAQTDPVEADADADA